MKYKSWELPGQASILSLDEAANFALKQRENYKYVIMTSCPADPIHPGHITAIQDSRHKIAERCVYYIESMCSPLIVVVNNDEFLKRKKGVTFMPLKVRCQIISALRGVDVVVPFSPTDPEDNSVCEAIRTLKPHFFTKGGDRDVSNIPETSVCDEVNTRIISGCGDDKTWSSSEFLNKYRKWCLSE